MYNLACALISFLRGDQNAGSSYNAAKHHKIIQYEA